jgi:hypothetical protein
VGAIHRDSPPAITSAKAQMLACNTRHVCINDIGRCVYEATDEYGVGLEPE